MAMSDSQLNSARARIQAAYSPELLSVASQTLSQSLTQHARLQQTPDAKVLNWNPPLENIQSALKKLNARSNSNPESEEQTLQSKVDDFQQLTQLMLDKGHNLQNPRYIGHQVPASLPLAGLFDAVASVTNQVMAVYEMGPWATAVEIALIELIGKEIGFPAGEFSGLVTHGGSLANLTGLLDKRGTLVVRIFGTRERKSKVHQTQSCLYQVMCIIVSHGLPGFWELEPIISLKFLWTSNAEWIPLH